MRRREGEYANLGHPSYFEPPKVLVRRTGDFVMAVFDEDGFYVSNNLFVVLPRRPDSQPSLVVLTGLLNSRLMTWYFRTIQPRVGKVFAELKVNQLHQFPLPAAGALRSADKRLAPLVTKMHGLATALRQAKTDHHRRVLEDAFGATDDEINQVVYWLLYLARPRSRSWRNRRGSRERVDFAGWMRYEGGVNQRSLSVLFRRVVLPALLLTSSVASAVTPLTKLTDVKLVGSPANDGDSFLVQAGDKQLHLRLYFVDCPETVVSNDVDAKRVREQAGYFGLTNAAHVVRYGREAQAFTAKALAKPFTVYTAYADAMGRSPTQRFYAFIVTADNKDLAGELVANGLARVFGAKRTGPDGATTDEWQQRLRDLETKAVLTRTGAWRESDAQEIVKQRANARAEERELADIRREAALPAGKIDLNTASSQQLQALPGVGPALAGKIIAARPYKSVEDLQRVRGMGARVFEQIRGQLTVTTPPAQPSSQNSP